MPLQQRNVRFDDHLREEYFYFRNEVTMDEEIKIRMEQAEVVC